MQQRFKIIVHRIGDGEPVYERMDNTAAGLYDWSSRIEMPSHDDGMIRG